MGRGDEDHALDEGQRREEHGLLQELSGLGTDVDLFERFVADVVPEPRPTVDGRELGQETALAVPDHHHAAEGRVLARGVESCTVVVSAARRRPAE